MAELRTLQSRIKTLNTRRVNILKGEQRRVSGSARVSLKRHIWLRDAGQCCICGRVVDLCDSELDLRGCGTHPVTSLKSVITTMPGP